MKKEISLTMFMSILWEMDYNVSVEQLSDGYLKLVIEDMQDYTSSMHGTDFYIKDDTELYDVLIENFSQHLKDYGINIY